MNTRELVVLVLAGGLALANLVVSVMLIRARYYTPLQKLVQCIAIWAIPLIGPTVVYAFLRTQEHAEIFDTRAYPEPSEKMVTATIGSAINDGFGDSVGGDGGGGD